MTLDPALLRSFLAVVDRGGFSAAAQALGLTQSAVSARIKRLEDGLGQTLLARTTRRVTPTEAGGMLVPYARRILRLQEAAEGALAPERHRPPLRLGISEEHGSAHLPWLLRRMTRRVPELRLEVTCAQSVEIRRLFEEGALDVAVTIRHGPGETGEVIGREPLAWAAHAGFALAPGAPVPLACNPEGCLYRALAQDRLSRVGREWRVVCTSPSPVGVDAAVEAGLAVCVKRVRAIPQSWRILGEGARLPALPPAEVTLNVGPDSLLPAETDSLAALIRQAFRDAARPPASA